MKMIWKSLVLISIIIVLSSCSPKENEVVVYTSVDRVYSEVIFQAFTKETGIKVLPVYDVEATKTTGLVQRLISEKNNPMCDVFWNGEIMYTIKLKEEGLLQTYKSTILNSLSDNNVDKDFQWYAFGGRARVFILNKEHISKQMFEFKV